MREQRDLDEAGEVATEALSGPPATEVVALAVEAPSEALLFGAGAAPWRSGRRISVAMLLPGLGLLWPVPAVGCLFLVAAAFGLAISSEAELAR